MMHCHMMNREEMGMMQTVEVYKDGSPLMDLCSIGEAKEYCNRSITTSS